MWSEREAVEVFHLVFLRAFGTRVDKALFAPAHQTDYAERSIWEALQEQVVESLQRLRP
jgi:hypothetical protein